MLPMPLAACRPLKCGYWDRGTESLILFNFKSCELATHGEYNCREIDLTGVDRIHWKEKQKTRSPVRLLFQSWCRVGTEAGNVERKTDEKWGRRESKIILWLATSLSSQSLLHLLAIQALPVCQVSSELIPAVFSHLLFSHSFSFSDKLSAHKSQVHTCSLGLFLSTPDPWYLHSEISQTRRLPILLIFLFQFSEFG